MTLRTNYRVPQANPAAQLVRSVIDRAGPTAPRERTLCLGELRILPNRQQRHWSLRKREFEIAATRESNKGVSDHSRVGRSIQKLTTAHLPVAGGLRELMRRCCGAARKLVQQQSEHQNLQPRMHTNKHE